MKSKKEIVKGEPILPVPESADRPETKPNVFINTLNLVVEPFEKHVVGHWHKAFYHPFDRHYKERYLKKWPVHASKILVIDLTLLALAAAAIVGGIVAYYVLPAPLPYSGVRAEIIAPSEPVSGRAEKLVVSWSNDSEETVACAALRLILPDGLVPAGALTGGKEGAAPCLPPGYEAGPGAVLVPLGDLRPSSRGTVIMPAYFLGTPDLPVVASAELLYWERGSTKLTHLGTRREWRPSRAALGLEMAVPKDVQRGRDTSLTLSYAAAEDLPAGTRISLATPADFHVTGTEPARNTDGTWTLPHLLKGATGQLRVYGRFAGREQAAPSFAATALYPAGDRLQAFASVRENADPRATDLAFTSEISSPAGATAVRPGEELGFTLRYRNLGEVTMRDVSFWVDEGGAALLRPVSGDGLSWSIQEIAPGETGALVVFMKTRDDIHELADGLRISFQASYLLSDEPGDIIFTDTAPMDFALAAAPVLTAKAVYYTPEGDQLGLGPLPPKIGETTKYWIFVKAETVGHGLDKTVVEAHLAPGVAWTGRASSTSGQPPRYDEATGRVNWEAGSVTPGTPLVAGFEVALTPDKDWIGTVPTLVTGWRLRAKDAVHALGLNTTAPDLNADLLGDSRAAGKGEVER